MSDLLLTFFSAYQPNVSLIITANKYLLTINYEKHGNFVLRIIAKDSLSLSQSLVWNVSAVRVFSYSKILISAVSLPLSIFMRTILWFINPLGILDLCLASYN